MAKRVYQQILILAIISFIPVVLAAGIASGYILGTFLEQQMKLPWIVFLACLVLGVTGSIVEVVRLIKLAIRTEKEGNHERRSE